VAENQAAYIAGWLRHIRDGTAADVVRAASDAQRAADWLTGGPVPASSLSTAHSSSGWKGRSRRKMYILIDGMYVCSE